MELILANVEKLAVHHRADSKAQNSRLHSYQRTIWNHRSSFVPGVGAVVYQSEGHWFDPWFPQSICRSVFEQDAEFHITPNLFTGL